MNQKANPDTFEAAGTEVEDIALRGFDKVNEFQLEIQGGLLDNLGVKMYTKLGKVLVEFAANAYDSDSPSVEIDFDFEKITAAREATRAAARLRLGTPGQGPKRKAQIIVDPLPQEAVVTISDVGHGMTPLKIAKRFLPLNRNRRQNVKGEETKLRTEAGKRLVMGRKGIGKLSAFGAAEIVTVTSKRAGQPFWTRITMVASELLHAKSLAKVPIAKSRTIMTPLRGIFASKSDPF